MTDSRDSQDNIFENATSQEEVAALLSAGPNEELRAEYQERFAATQSDAERRNLAVEIQLEQQKQAKEAGTEFASPFYDQENVEDVVASETPEDLAKVAEDAGFARDIYGGQGEASDADRKARYLGWDTDRLDVNESGDRLPEAKIAENVEKAMAEAETDEQRHDVLRRAGLTAKVM